MKGLISTIILLLSATYSLKGQTEIIEPSLPVDTTLKKVRLFKDITLDPVIIRDTMWDIKQDEVFHRADYWFRTFFTNPTSVIKEHNKYDKIIGRHKLRLYNIDPKSGAKTVNAYLLYDVIILCKDGTYSYEVSNLRKHQSNPQPVEKWVDMNGIAHPQYKVWVKQIEAYLNEISISVERTMAKSPNDQ